MLLGVGKFGAKWVGKFERNIQVTNGWTGVFSATTIGAIKGVFQHYGGAFISRTTISLTKYVGRVGGDLLSSTLLKPNGVLFKIFHDYRLIYREVVWPRVPKLPRKTTYTASDLASSAIKVKADFDDEVSTLFTAYKAAAGNTAERGVLGEKITKTYFERLGYTVRNDLHYSGDRGIDLVAYKGTWPNVTDAFIIEAKSVSADGTIGLSNNVNVNDQMTDAWISLAFTNLASKNTGLSTFANQAKAIFTAGKMQKCVTGINVNGEVSELIQLFLK